VKRGTLYLVATPIGNLEDITLRALRILGEVDLVACEDTRRTQHLLERHRVRKRLVSYFGAREKEKARALIGFLREGKSVALVSDAGMPGISDPGALVARMAIAEGFDVVPVPGPVALAAALALRLIVLVAPAAVSPGGVAAKTLFRLGSVAVFLSIFNLAPIPPLDGYHVLTDLLRVDPGRSEAFLRASGPWLILLLINTPFFTGALAAAHAAVVRGLFLPVAGI